jgi:S1-C subfamily serine protease
MACLAALGLALTLLLPTEGRRTPVVEVVEKAGPAVVNISAEIVEQQNPFRRSAPVDDFWRHFLNEPRARPRTAQSLGSGVIIDKTGLVLTNEHVVARATSVTVTLGDRRSYEVDVVGADPTFDIAVLRIKMKSGDKVPFVELGASNDLMPGETVVAIGNPFGLANTVTTGVVSALHRVVQAEERTYEDFVQTDASINPGNSGGALLNIEGKLIGINTAILAGTGIGFAIPIDRAMAVVNEVLHYGEVRPVYLGIEVDPGKTTGGAVVRAIEPDSAGATAGVQPGDRIVDLGGQEVQGSRSFNQLVHGLIPGQTVKLQVVRDGKPLAIELKAKELTPERAKKIGRARLGLEVKEGARGFLVISSVRNGSDAARVGIREGDALLSIGGRSLRKPADFDAVVGALHDVEAVAVIVGRGGRQYYVTLQLG